jgi:tRNA pseudouridine38-40 synthase
VARANVSWYYRSLNHRLMHDAAQCLIGEHNFSSFQASECQSKSPNRRVSRIEVKRTSDYIVIEITANAFLHHMVRNIVGVLMLVGVQKKDKSWVEEVLNAQDRSVAAETAPPYGLYLLDVAYPDHFGLPSANLNNLVCKL